jgi:DNA repair protein RecO (recombination protein O)
MLPDAEPAERYFRLLETVLGHLRSRKPGSVWRAVTYFSLWTVRLSGLLPELHACLECGNWLEDPDHPRKAFFNRFQHGLLCEECRRSLDMRNSWELSADSRLLAQEMLRTPVAAVRDGDWPDTAAANLRRFLVQRIESQIERKLVTFPALEGAA